ncbi:MAG: thioredoxin family protein [Chloroflexi bacterium]|nr:thioredoxin family protein [Chloroflexota bacterium]
MPIIKPSDQQLIQAKFDRELVGEVPITLYTQKSAGSVLLGLECAYCQQTQELLEDLAGLSPKLHLEVMDFVVDAGKAQKEGVDKIPAILMGKGRRLRFFGLPSGYEFAATIETMVDVSRGSTSLSQATKEGLKKIDKPVHLQVFVTPTCPYCPQAARLAHQMALESPLITADVVEITEFPHLAQRYRVQGVPKVVINDKVEFVGAQPEAQFLSYVLTA